MHYLRPPNATDGGAATDSSGVIMHLTAAPVARAAVRGGVACVKRVSCVAPQRP